MKKGIKMNTPKVDRKKKGHGSFFFHPSSLILHPFLSSSFRCLRILIRFGWLVEDQCREVFDEVMHDSPHGEHADWPALLIDNGEVAIASFLHAANRSPHWVFWADRDRVGRHARTQWCFE